MMIKTTYILTLLLLSCKLFAFEQNSTINQSDKIEPKFSLTISSYNHAHQIFDGTLIYNLTNSILTISRRMMFSDKDTILFTKMLDANSVTQIQIINLDSLENYYSNNCIMLTSGNEYFVSITRETITKTIHLHAYYLKQIDFVINELNKHIPESLKINYLESDTEQDCK